MPIFVFVEECLALTEAQILEETNRRDVFIIDPAHRRTTIHVPELQGFKHVALASEFLFGIRTVRSEIGLTFERDLAMFETADYPIVNDDELPIDHVVQRRSVKERFGLGFFQESLILLEMRLLQIVVKGTNDEHDQL